MQNLNSTTGSRGAYFRWTPPDEAISIDVHLNIVQFLERRAVRAGENSAAGLLLGRMEAGHLIVEGAEATTPETGAPQFSFTDLAALQPILDRWRLGKKRISLVGLYRSSGQVGSALNKEDLTALCACTGGTDVTVANARRQSAESEHKTRSETEYKQSAQLFLLIESRANQAASATLYLTRGGALLQELSLTPFNRAELSKQQIAEKMNAPCAPLLRQEVKTDFEERNPSPARGIQLKEVIKWRWVVAPAAIAVVTAFLVLGGRQQLASLRGIQASSDNHLGLKVQRSGNDWELGWDQDAPIVLDAANGHLRINDGAIHKELELAPSELRNGRIIYTPMSDDVAIELEVESPKSGRPFRESVRIVAGLLPLQESQAAIAGRVRSYQGKTLRSSGIANPTRSTALAADPQHSTLPNSAATSNTVVPAHIQSPMPQASLERKGKEDQKNTETEHERVNEPSVSFSERSAFLDSPERLVPLPSPSAPAGGKIEPARCISRSDPIYPQLAKRQQIAGNVEVNFKISANGEVHDLKAKGPAILTEAAIEAVRKWRYVPARLNGISTETKATTIVAFRLN